MSDIAIRVEGLSKQYRIGKAQPRYRTLRDSLVETGKAPFRRAASLLRGQAYGAAGLQETLWALKDVSFEVKEGEVLGVIGANGAGKTTLLKILSRITEPTEGAVDLYGQVGSLLEVGTGFHPELTGRENVYLNGAILGMSREEIARKFDEIVAFSEIEKFIDTPVKHYSSGMYVRLAFAVAAHLEPEILLVDEVLAGGDAAFQKKCRGKMQGVASEGRTVLFVSHNMRSVVQLCAKVLWLDGGKGRLSGPAEHLVNEYLSAATSAAGLWKRPPDSTTRGDLSLLEGRLAQDGSQVKAVSSGRPFDIEIVYRIASALRGCSVVIRLADMNGTIILTTWDTDAADGQTEQREPGLYVSACRVPSHLLAPGRYSVSLTAHIPRVKTLDVQRDAFSFDLTDVGYRLNPDRKGVVRPILNWNRQLLLD